MVASKLGGTGERTYTIKVGSAYLTGVTQVSVGASHSCAIVNGGAWCWGGNSNGKLGDGTTVNRSTPVQVSGLTSGVTQISAGYHTCAIVNGGAWCWGSNGDGQLGNNSTTASPIPVQVSGLASGVTQISAGVAHTCAVVNGGARCWGGQPYGQLGNNSTATSTVPVQVNGLTSGVSSISADNYQTCAVVSGSAKCWGINGTQGALGNNSTTNSLVPVQVNGLTSGVTQISTGNGSVCAIGSGGILYCWGSNTYGQIGDGTKTNRPSPVQITALGSGVTWVSAGGNNTCAIQSGSAKCWGSNTYGQLGDGTTTDSSVPVQVTGLTNGVTQIGISTGGNAPCALVGVEVRCWGQNGSGQLGDGTTTNRTTPVQVASP